MEKMI